jgi:hypothetical protein
MTWEWTTTAHTANSAGVHLVYAQRPGRERTDVTYFRGVPLILNEYTYSDPYSDATASITFPQITEVDDLDAVWWCQEFTEIDIYWAPASASKISPGDIRALNPDTGLPGWWINVPDPTYNNYSPVWEGHIYSYTPTPEGAQVQLQGAMFAVDRYVSKPTFPPRPQAAEFLIMNAFNSSPTQLKTFTKSDIHWPAGWTKVYDGTINQNETLNNFSVDGVAVGENYSGYATRNTGNWGRMLTGFVSELLGVMYTPDKCGAIEGNQWTVLMGTGRQPYLTVRDRFRAPDFWYYAGTPGIITSLSRDALSTSSIYYGTGTGPDGSKWSNTAISPDGSKTEYQPIAYMGNHYPFENNPNRTPGTISGETMITFGSGIGLDQAIIAGEKMLRRDYDPGWVGDIELKVDPTSINKWSIRPGMCVQVRNYGGLQYLNLHIAQVRCNPDEGTVTLSVDSKFRDLLSLEEVTSKIRDPLTPAKLLQVGRRTGIVEDQLAPWDYTAGSGMVKTEAVEFFLEMPRSIRFPWTEWTRSHPPRDFGQYYLPVNASSDLSANRWNACSFLTSSKGTIRMTQFVCVDEDGEIVPIPFHVSIHNVNMLDDANIDTIDSEVDNGTVESQQWTAYVPNAAEDSKVPPEEIYSPFANDKMWERTASNGTTLTGTMYPPPEQMIIGWGNYSQPAGYSPGRKSEGGQPTGMLIDESAWPYDNAGGDLSNERVDPQGRGNSLTKTKLLCAIYAEHDEQVYFIGRMWKQEEGV